MKKKRHIQILIGALMMITALTITPVSCQASAQGAVIEAPVKSQSLNGLAKEGTKYRYYQNGKILKSKWKTIKGKKYYFDGKGYAVTGSKKIKGKYYVFNSKGKLYTGKKTRIVKIGKVPYIVNAKGQALKGWQIVSGRLYYAAKNGKCTYNKTYKKFQFNKSGQATSYKKKKLNGIYVAGEGNQAKLYSFTNGKCNTAETKTLQKYLVYRSDPTGLMKLLGEPLSRIETEGCSGEAGQEVFLNYPNLQLNVLERPDGSRICFGINPR